MIRFRLHYSLAKCIFTNHTWRAASVTFDVFPIHSVISPPLHITSGLLSNCLSVLTLVSFCVFIHVISSSLTPPHSPSFLPAPLSFTLSRPTPNSQSAVNAGRHSLPPLYFFQLPYSLFMKGWVREGKDVRLIAHWVRRVWYTKVQWHKAWVNNN